MIAQDLERQLAEWLHVASEVLRSRATGEPPKDLITADRAVTAMAMPVADYALEVLVFVSPNRARQPRKPLARCHRRRSASVTTHLCADRVRIVPSSQVAERVRRRALSPPGSPHRRATGS